MRLFVRAVAALCIALGGISNSNAIGDSGGGCNFQRSAIGHAVAAGTPADFERAVVNWLDYDEQQNYRKGGFFSFGEVPSRAAWRQERTKLLLEGKVPEGCVPPLLREAIIRGNIDVANFLLKMPFGIELRVNIDTINVCPSWPARLRLNDEERSKLRKALAFVLEVSAIDLNAPATGGQQTVLQTCPEPDLLKLFVEHGARVDTESDQWSINASSGMNMTLLELAIAEALFFKETSYTARRLNGVERARFFATMLPTSIEGRPVEKFVRRYCNPPNGPQLNPKTCDEFAKLVKATSGTFRSSDSFQDAQPVAPADAAR